ncbi:MAG: asparagine synthase (glutamine-hydrolyzing) [Patescibacteria group bacterium]|jgi:asparagine synthase (glutamine-hydrolysing)
MCGVTGFVNFNSIKPSKVLLQKMTDVITHRGPDDGGTEVINQCALGNRRLAIIDLSPHGHMPMWDYEHKICITYNGEIYNFNTLKKSLLKKGYRFNSNSDTEVILNLYKEYGSKCVTKLRGMFAFAIWDTQKHELLIARDHFGIKPLHYFLSDSVFVFGSEIKSILLHPEIKKEVNPTALSHYFSLGFGCIASPETIFKGISKLPPAHYAIIKNGKLKIVKYWSITDVKEQNIAFGDAVEKTKSLIENSVKDQLVSDVPLGTFLSGGIDSSLVSTFAQQHTKHTLKTFSIGFEDKKFDESQYAKQVSQHLKTEHYHKTFSVKNLLNTLPKVIEKLDEPLADASILPTYLLSEFTRENVTVSLSGDGGDELFAGYPTYIAHKFAQPFSILSSGMLKALKNTALHFENFASLLPAAKHAVNLSTRYKLERFFDGIDKDLAKQYLNYMGPTHLVQKNFILKQLKNEDVALNYVHDLLAKIKHWETQKKLQYLDFRLFLAEDCLVKTDRASSFNSLEVRPPFLSLEIAEFVFSLPSSYHFNGLTLKRLLKKVSSNYLPEEIVNRPKKGFGIPTGEWLKADLNLQMKSLLAKSKLKKEGLFNHEHIQVLIAEHEKGIKNHRMVLWNLFMFELWYEQWMK